MLRRCLCALPFLVLGPALDAQQPDPPEAPAAAGSPVTASTLSVFKLRGIGPAITSGRLTDIAIDPADRSHWYVTVAAGGVWETENAGTTWKPIFDGQPSFSIGCITIDPYQPLTVWVGSGENNSQRAVCYGDGVYKSTDGGRSWKNVGLPGSEHIGRILVDPRNGDRVFVAAQGPLWSAGGDRGLYLTEDGGETWQCVLEIDEHTGVSDVVMDPDDPNVLYASSYQRRRHVFTLVNGGPGSGVHKSIDGGRTWQKLSGGLPGGEVGRIGLATAPSRPGLVYAIVEAQGSSGGFFRSLDYGASWQRRSDYTSGSPQYYQELFVDPSCADRIYSMDVRMQVSEDGGATWRGAGETDKHVDNHALWIDPDDPRHLLCGTDGGLYETFDGCRSWRFFDNLPITQFYRVTADEDFPFYNVYGGTQDNYSLGGPARTTHANGITNREWFVTRGGDGFETVVDPEDPDVVYSQSQHGGLIRYDRSSGETIGIKPLEGPDDEPLRWNWNAPLIISPHSHTRLYFAANYLFRSDDRGNTWRKVGGNLSRQLDRNQLEVMGKVWSVDAVAKNKSTSIYGNVVALSESPVQEDRIYVGSDDGLIQVTTDAAHWTKFDNFPDVPELCYVSCVLASRHAAETVYAAFDNHKRGDFKPYLLASVDGGKSWTSIAGDLPGRGSVHTIAEDHVNPDLLFVGTEFGLFCTVDRGAHWLRLKSGLPPIPVRDLHIQRREDDLVLATFGRGFFVLDDYSPLRAITAEALASPAWIFPVKKAWQFVPRRPLGGGGRGFLGSTLYTAPNPEVGAVITWHLKESLKTKKQLRQAAESKAAKAGEPVPYPSWEELRAEDREVKPQVMLVIRDAVGQAVRRLTGSTSKGMHRTTWDLRYDAPGRGYGPLAPPGTYTVTVARLVDGVYEELSAAAKITVESLPGLKFPATDPAEVLTFLQQAQALDQDVRAAVTATQDALTRLDAVDRALPSLAGMDPAWLQEAYALRQRLAEVQIRLSGDPTISSRYEAEPPSISQRARAATGSTGTRNAPTNTQREAFAVARRQLTQLLPELRTLCEQELTTLEQKVEAAGGPPPRGKLPRSGR